MKYRLQETVDCDSSIETCNSGASEVIEGTSGADLANLVFTVGALELLLPILNAYLTDALFPGDIVNEFMIYVIPTLLFSWPNLTYAFQAIWWFSFGNNYTSSDIDTELVWMIQDVMSNLTPLILIISFAAFIEMIRAYPDSRGATAFYLIGFTLSSFAF